MTIAFASHPRDPNIHATVLGVHGSPGKTGWKAFYTRRHLESPTEAVEWATLPPGGVSGEHLHTRTEEIYIILEGKGEIALNGSIYPVKSGSLILTPPGNIHGLRNTGETTLNWFVVETLAPFTQSAIQGSKVTLEETMPAHYVDLHKNPLVDTTEYFDGPMTSVERISLKKGDLLTIKRAHSEVAGYINCGAVTIWCDGQEKYIDTPSAFLVPHGDTAQVFCSKHTEIYLVELKVNS